MRIALAISTAAAAVFFYVEGVYLGFSESGVVQGLVHAAVPMIAMQHGLGHSYGFWP